MEGIYGPNGNFIYVGPNLTYSMSDTMELAVIGQYYSMDEVTDFSGNSIANSGSAIFVRLKWAF